MRITIDSNVEFDVNGKTVKVDARELCEFRRALFEAHAKPDPDKPDEVKLLDWDVIIPETIKFIKENAGVDIVASEAMGIFEHADKAWADIRKNWQPPTAATATSLDSTDPRYSED